MGKFEQPLIKILVNSLGFKEAKKSDRQSSDTMRFKAVFALIIIAAAPAFSKAAAAEIGDENEIL